MILGFRGVVFSMGSTGEADKKRRHFSSISPTGTAMKLSFVEKKRDAGVLQFQNQKLTQTLEAQKIEIQAFQDKLFWLKDKQQSHEKTLAVVNSSWGELVDDVESHSNCILNSMKHGRGFACNQLKDDGDSLPEDALMGRLLETGATESSTACALEDPAEEDGRVDGGQIKEPKKLLHNMVASFDGLNGLKDRLYTVSLKAVSSNGQNRRAVSSELQTEVKKFRLAVLKLHLKHKVLAGKLQNHRDNDAKNKTTLKRVKGELESTLAELHESNHDLTILKAERDSALGTSFTVLNQGNKHLTNGKTKDKQQDLRDMESTLKELLDQSTSQLHELKRLHEDSLDILRQLSDLQNNLKNVNHIGSTLAYCMLKDQLAKAKADVVKYQAICEELQVEKESLYWREKENQMKNELVNVLQWSSSAADSRISDLEMEIQRCIKEKDVVTTKMEKASKEPGRKEIISEFKALVSSFPEKMGSMQNQLANHKETAADIHCLRAEVDSLTNILNHKAKELDILTSRSALQNAEILKLQATISDLKVGDADLKLFLDMYARQSVGLREVNEARHSEIKAWVIVQGLKSNVDEHNLELRVKVAIEAEAKAQQRLAASEAEIAELRQKLEASKRGKAKLLEVLKSKQEETEAYLSEIETIGQAYDDMQTQNQQLLQQISERDDYNVKLVLEGVCARHVGDALHMEKHMLEKVVLHMRKTVDFYDFIAGRIEDQLKAYLDHMMRTAEDRVHNTAAVENTQRRLSDVRRSSQQVTNTLDEAQSRVERSRGCLTELKMELEKERFDRKRVEEDLQNLRRKAQKLKSQAEGSSVNEKLKQELREYEEILKCSVCLDRRKEVVITKCYHLLCNPCVQRIIEMRHRKCPVCAASFGANDVKPVYI